MGFSSKWKKKFSWTKVGKEEAATLLQGGQCIIAPIQWVWDMQGK